MAESPERESTPSKRLLNLYQCKNCNIILGNSDSLMSEFQDEKCIVLSEVENAMMSTTVKTSKDLKDKGCKYQVVECHQCHEDVGIYYAEVPEGMEQLEKKYKLHLININSVKTMVNVTNNSDEVVAKLAEHSQKFDDVAVMLVNATLDRITIKSTIQDLASCLRFLKDEIERLESHVDDLKSKMPE